MGLALEPLEQLDYLVEGFVDTLIRRLGVELAGRLGSPAHRGEAG